MFRYLLWFGCISWYIILSTASYSENSSQGFLSFSPNETVISEKIHYIPVGHHAKFACETLDKFRFISEKKRVFWEVKHMNSVPHRNMLISVMQPRKTTSFSSSSTAEAYIHGARMSMNGTLLECSIEADDDHKPKRSFSSRVVLVIQDCGKQQGIRSMSMNKLNPCRHGSCRVRKDNGFELLECSCIEQYTGLYCDQLVEWAIFYEIMYYSPFFTLIAVMVFASCCYTCVGDMRKECPMSFEKHVLRENLSVDMKMLYPAMFISSEQYAEMAADIPEEVDAIAPGSNEWLKAPTKGEKTGE